MKSLTFKKERDGLTSAFLYSLMIHFAAGALLIFGLSTGLSSSPRINGLHLIWVSLNNKSLNNTVRAGIQQPQPVVKEFPAKTANIEKPVSTEETRQGHATAVFAQAAYPTATVQHEPSGTDSNAALSNITASGAIGTAGKTSGTDNIIAYPLYKENVKPAYPAIAKSLGYEGIVLVSAEILPDGCVGEVKIRKSSGYAILDQSALKAVKPWKFVPARKSGNPFTQWVELPIKFILNNHS